MGMPEVSQLENYKATELDVTGGAQANVTANLERSNLLKQESQPIRYLLCLELFSEGKISPRDTRSCDHQHFRTFGISKRSL